MKAKISSRNYACFIVLLGLLMGCTNNAKKMDTGLLGGAAHTGTMFMYRVPPVDEQISTTLDIPNDGVQKIKLSKDNKRPQIFASGQICGNHYSDWSNCNGITKRFVPLQPIMDLSGFENKDTNTISAKYHITADDYVSIKIDSVFIKYFQEKKGVLDNFSDLLQGNNHATKGEVVVILSFSSGSENRDNYVAFSSRGQTLGSYLGVQHWPVIGPVKVDGQELKVRIVMIEVDQGENRRIKDLIKLLTNASSSLMPEISPVLKMSQTLAEVVIAQNRDDVILDQRFSLKRINKGEKLNNIFSPPLLFGRYVLLFQEDRLKNDDVQVMAKEAIIPPALSRIRFGLEDNMLYRTYDYWTDRWGWPGDPNISELPTDRKEPDSPGPKRIDLDKIYYLGGCKYEPLISKMYKSNNNLQENKSRNRNNKSKFLTRKYCEHRDAYRIRHCVLGYNNPRTTGVERWDCLEQALRAAYCESKRRYINDISRKSDDQETAIDQTTSNKLCEDDELGPNKTLDLDFPIVIYPTANVALSRYSFHTHIVLTIEEATETLDKPIHELFVRYDEFVKNSLTGVANKDEILQINKIMLAIQEKTEEQLNFLRKIKYIHNDVDKICRIYDYLRNKKETTQQTTVDYKKYPMIYNAIYKLTNHNIQTFQALENYMRQKQGDLRKQCS